MKKFLSLMTVSVLSALTIFAQSVTTTVTGGTPLNLISTSGVLIDNITFTATSTNLTTVKFYDSSASGTTIVRAAYSRYASYTTNFDNVWTNESGLLVTNTFDGIYTYPTSVAAVTNERPKLFTMVVIAGGQKTKETILIPGRGLTVFSDNDGIVEVNYRNQ